jgi:hypothetical protein
VNRDEKEKMGKRGGFCFFKGARKKKERRKDRERGDTHFTQ